MSNVWDEMLKMVNEKTFEEYHYESNDADWYSDEIKLDDVLAIIEIMRKKYPIRDANSGEPEKIDRFAILDHE